MTPRVDSEFRASLLFRANVDELYHAPRMLLAAEMLLY